MRSKALLALFLTGCAVTISPEPTREDRAICAAAFNPSTCYLQLGYEVDVGVAPWPWFMIVQCDKDKR